MHFNFNSVFFLTSGGIQFIFKKLVKRESTADLIAIQASLSLRINNSVHLAKPCSLPNLNFDCCETPMNIENKQTNKVSVVVVHLVPYKEQRAGPGPGRSKRLFHRLVHHYVISKTDTSF